MNLSMEKDIKCMKLNENEPKIDRENRSGRETKLEMKTKLTEHNSIAHEL